MKNKRPLFYLVLMVIGVFIPCKSTKAQIPGLPGWFYLGSGVGSNDSVAIQLGVYNMTTYNGSLYAVGSFTYLNGQPHTGIGLATHYIAKWKDSTWLPVGNGLTSFYQEAQMAVYHNKLYYAGPAPGDTVSYATGIYAWNDSTWSTVGNAPQITALSTADILFAVWNDKLTAVSWRAQVTGQSYINSILTVYQWDGNTWALADSTFDTMTVSNQGPVIFATAVYNNELYVAGSFKNLNGILSDNIIKWNGTNWSAVGGGLGNGMVNALTVFQGNLYAGGNFVTAGADTVNSLAVWNGTTWNAVQSGVTGTVNSFCTIGNNLYFGGAFSKQGYVFNNIAQWNGTQMEPVYYGINGTVNALTNFKNNLIAGGVFADVVSINGLSLGNFNNIAGRDIAPTTIIAPANETVCANTNATFIATSSSDTVQWQLSTNGGLTFNNIAGATDTLYSIQTINAQSGYQYRAIFFNQGQNDTTSAGILTLKQAPIQPLCLVTSDTANTEEIIVWEKSDKYATDSFFIYRANTPDTTYQLVAAIPRDSLSEYVDVSANPNQTSYRYKMNVKDTCGNYSVMSNFHQTIYLQYLGSGNFEWTPYLIENNPSPVNTYDFYRDSTGNDTWQLLTSVANTQTTAADADYLSYPNARYKIVVTLANSCVPTRGLTTITSNILSHLQPAGIVTVSTGSITIVPNPANNKFELIISNPQITINSFIMLDQLGNKLVVPFSISGQGKILVNIDRLASGLYYVMLNEGTGRPVIKLMKY